MRPLRKTLTRAVPVVGLSGALLAGMLTPSGASSHREAPMISMDPTADETDIYAFVSPDDASKLTVVMDVIPFQEPASGPDFYSFADDVVYRFEIDNNGDARTDVGYSFKFNTRVRNKDTYTYATNQVTSIDDPDLTAVQTYSVWEEWRFGREPRERIGTRLPVVPYNAGPRTFPDYPAVAAQGVRDIGDGIKVFAGPRDDPFFADLGRIFDLGSLGPFLPAHLIPGEAEDGIDYLSGLNVHSIVMQIPIDTLVNEEPVLGIYGTTFRQANRALARNRSGVVTNSGPQTQVSRLGNPLVNEVVIPRASKDRFNASHPRGDGQFLPRVLNSELAGLIEVLYPGVDTPQEVDLGLGLGGREDLATVFLTGIPGVNQPANVVPAEMLRVNTTTASGFPNGRLLTDDVVDIELQVVAGATAFSPEFNKAPNNQLGDGVDANDKEFLSSFPYLALPHDPVPRL